MYKLVRALQKKKILVPISVARPETMLFVWLCMAILWPALAVGLAGNADTVRSQTTLKEFKVSLESYDFNGICRMARASLENGASDLYAARELAMSNGKSGGDRIATRQAIKAGFGDFELVANVLGRLIKTEQWDGPALGQKRTWDEWAVGHGWESLEIDRIQPFVKRTRLFLQHDSDSVVRNLMCRPGIWNGIIGGGETEPMCLGHPCDDDEDLCRTEDIESQEFGDTGVARTTIERRARKRLSVWCASTGQWVGGLKINPRPYPSAGEWTPHSKQYMTARTWVSETDCGNPSIHPRVKGGSHHDTEHLIELQTVPMFFQHTTMGALVSGRSATFSPIDCEMFLPVAQGGQDMMQMDLLPRRPLFLGDDSRSRLSSRPEYRLMNALGSNRNNVDFYLLEKEVNGMKRRVGGNLP